MDPFRDELAAAHARIAELEASLATLRPRAKPSAARGVALVASFLSILFGFSTWPVEFASASTAPVGPSRTWECRFPHEADPPQAPMTRAPRAHIDCFSGEYECR